MDEKKTIFFFPAWYPHRGDSMFGLFVKRHAEAVSRYCRVGVVFAIGESRENGDLFDVVELDENTVSTIRVYYKKSDLKGAATFVNGLRYLRAVMLGYAALVKKLGEPQVNHVHVLTRAGIFALYKNITTGTPYIITEHWSRYLPINKGAYVGFLRKQLTKWIVRNAAAVTPVSDKLAQAMKSYGLQNAKYVLVNNVVDVSRFIYRHKSNDCFRWLHVSCFDDEPKNITGLLRGFAKAYEKDKRLSLTLVGEGIDFERINRFASELSLPNEALRFTGKLEGEALQQEFMAHDAFVLFSRYENQPVVIIEAFACGLPVLATRVGSIPQLLEQNRGVLVDSENEQQLEEALLDFAQGKLPFSREHIRQFAVNTFSMEAVGQSFNELYISALNKS